MLTIKPRDYGRIAHKHNQVALTLKAVGKSADAAHHGGAAAVRYRGDARRAAPVEQSFDVFLALGVSDQIGRRRAHTRQHVGARWHVVDRVPGPFEIVPDEIGDIDAVFDDEHTRHDSGY